MGWTCLRSQNHLIKIIVDPVGKRSLGRPLLRWEDVIRKDVDTLNGGRDWKTRAVDRKGLRIGCVMGWSSWMENLRRRRSG